VVSILGISAFYHDSAACLVVDGDVFAAAQEERFSRIKHDYRFPAAAARYCLKEANLSVEDLNYVAFYDKPLLKFDRLLETYLDYSPSGFSSFLKSMPLWIREKLWMPDLIRTELAKVDGAEDDRDAKKRGKRFQWKLLFGDHHESHAASAFYPSPFEHAAILTIDGVGEWATSSIGIGKGHEITLLKELRYPDSLGLLYSAFTYYTGFKVNSGEYKVMGLAPYGEPTFVAAIKDKLLDIRDDGSIRMNHEYFGYSQGLRMTNGAFDKIFGGPPRKPESKLSQREMDLACSIQVITEEVMLKMARYTYEVTGEKRLCMAGGVALNCVANTRLLADSPFSEIWVQPAAGDSGTALGAALAVAAEAGDDLEPMTTAALGRSWSDTQIELALSTARVPYQRPADIAGAAAEIIADDGIVAWFQSRAEYGPRALGHRSLLAHPAREGNTERLNDIKGREQFRPVAPMVLSDRAAEIFDRGPLPSPYMLFVHDVAPAWQERLQAVTHVDGTARMQTVDASDDPLTASLLTTFDELTDIPVVVNTSLNTVGRPMVDSPRDALELFGSAPVDALAIGPYLVRRP